MGCCSCDVASTTAVVWEGLMGTGKPAFLFVKTSSLQCPTAERQVNGQFQGSRSLFCCLCKVHDMQYAPVVLGRTEQIAGVMPRCQEMPCGWGLAHVPRFPRAQEHLTSGVFLLKDVSCRGCGTVLGWRYLKSFQRASDEIYPGSFLLPCAHTPCSPHSTAPVSQALLVLCCVSVDVASAVFLP